MRITRARPGRTAKPCITAIVGAVLLVAACDDGENGGAGDVGDDQADSTQVGQELEFADRPELTPCPEGWREVEHEAGFAVCDPWPEGGPMDCASLDSAHFPGEPGCTQIGEPCPEGDWSESLPTDATLVYVRPGAEGAGDGSRDDPYGTLADGLGAAPPGAVVALAKGTYDRVVTISADVTLWGACVAETVLDAPEALLPPEDNSLMIAGADAVAFRNLRFAGGTAGVLVTQDATLEMTDVTMTGVLFGGVGDLSTAATSVRVGFTGRNLIFRDFRGDQLPERGAFGFNLIGGGSFTLDRAVVSNLSSAIGLFNSQIEIQDVALLDFVEASGLGGPGESRGISVFDGTTGSIRRVIVSSVATGALFAGGEGTEIEVEDFVTTGDPDPSEGSGPSVTIHNGAKVDLSNAWIRGHQLAGVRISGGSATLSDVVIEDIDGLFVAGALAMVAGDATGQRIALVENRGTGVALGNQATLDVSDLIVIDTGELACEPAEICPEGPLGMGVSVQSGSTITLAEFELTAAALCGFQLIDGEATLSQGVVQRNPIGVNIQRADFDFEQIAPTVVFVDNENNLDAVSLPVPDLTPLTQVLP